VGAVTCTIGPASSKHGVALGRTRTDTWDTARQAIAMDPEI